MTLGRTIALYRKTQGLTQDALAQQLEVTNQAVSKWELDQSCPDIMLLPRLADLFGISIDRLFGREPESPKAEPQVTIQTDLPWEDDGNVRGVLYVGTRLLQFREAGKPFDFELEGDVQNVYCDFSVKCGNVEGNVDAGGNVSCGNVCGNVDAGSVNCDDVGGNVICDGSVECRSVEGSVGARNTVKCNDVSGNVDAGSVYCDDVKGNVICDGRVECRSVEGGVGASNTVKCNDVSGNVDAGSVYCDDVEGNVICDGSVECRSVEGSVGARNTVKCRDVGGDVDAGNTVQILGSSNRD